MAIRESRNVELSTLYYLETEFAANWTGVNIVKSFALVEQTDTPVVCIENESKTHVTREIGDTALNHTHVIIINIFADSSAQRMDLADFVLDKIRTGYTYYQWSYDEDKNYEKVAESYLRLKAVITDTKLPQFDTMHKKERFRHELSFTVSRY